MVFLWSLNDSKFPVTRTLLSILADLSNVVVWFPYLPVPSPSLWGSLQLVSQLPSCSIASLVLYFFFFFFFFLLLLLLLLLLLMIMMMMMISIVRYWQCFFFYFYGLSPFKSTLDCFLVVNTSLLDGNFTLLFISFIHCYIVFRKTNRSGKIERKK